MPELLLLALRRSFGSDVSPNDSSLYEFQSRARLWNTPHLGLLTVGAMVKDRFKISYIDMNYERVRRWNYDYVFMSPTTSQAGEAYGLAQIFRQHGTKVALGGPHVTMLPQEARPYADCIFVGEAEPVIHRFHAASSGIVLSAEEKPDLRQTPLPLYSLALKYPYTSIPIQLSRGCPHQCAFCLSSRVHGRHIRRKSLEQARIELQQIKKLYANPFVFFTDDNFFINTQYALKIMDILEEIKVSWYAFTDISVYTKTAVVDRLYSSGCRKLLIGFESLNSKNLKAVNPSGFKESKVKEYETAIDVIQREKIGIVGSFVLGLEYDDESTFDELYRFILKTAVYGTNVTIATPFPGTDFYDTLQKKQALSKDWSLYDGFTLVYDLPGISRKVFMDRYAELIRKINSQERLGAVINYFRQVV